MMPQRSTIARWGAAIGSIEGLGLNLFSVAKRFVLADAIPPESIQRTPWASLLGAPVTLWAVLIYATMLIMLIRSRTPKGKLLIASLGWTLVLAPVWFMSLQFFVLHHFCGYCLGSHLAGLVAGGGAVIYGSNRRVGLGVGVGLLACLIAIQCGGVVLGIG